MFIILLNTRGSEAGVQIKLLKGTCRGCPNGSWAWRTDWGRCGAPDPDACLAGGHPGPICTPCLGAWGSERKWSEGGAGFVAALAPLTLEDTGGHQGTLSMRSLNNSREVDRPQ